MHWTGLEILSSVSFHVYSHGSSRIIGLKLHLISERDQSAAAPIKRPCQEPDNMQTEAC